MAPLRVALAQIAPRLGALEENLERHHELIAEAKEHEADLVGISALLTTTMVGMKDAVTAVRAAAPGAKVIGKIRIGNHVAIGANAVVFMGALYALRGAGVFLAVTGGGSFFGWLLLAVGFLILAPFMIMGAAFIGLGDTWFDLRGRKDPVPPEA